MGTSTAQDRAAMDPAEEPPQPRSVGPVRAYFRAADRFVRAMDALDWTMWSAAFVLSIFLAVKVLPLTLSSSVHATERAVPDLESGQLEDHEHSGQMRLFELGDGEDLLAEHAVGERYLTLHRGTAGRPGSWTYTLELPASPRVLGLVAGDHMDRLLVLSEDDRGVRSLLGFDLTAAEPAQLRASWMPTFDGDAFGGYVEPRAFQILSDEHSLAVLLAHADDRSEGRLFRVPLPPCSVGPQTQERLVAAHATFERVEAVAAEASARELDPAHCALTSAPAPRVIGEPMTTAGAESIEVPDAGEEGEILVLDAEGATIDSRSYAELLAAGVERH